MSNVREVFIMLELLAAWFYVEGINEMMEEDENDSDSDEES
jgi:hypothetical protein